MGKQNSSKTRVEPVFKALHDRDPTGLSWIAPLLGLPVNGASRSDLTAAEIGELDDWGWGNLEKKLDPPLSLLNWLIDHAELQPGHDIGKSEVTVSKRKSLLAHDRQTLLEAKSLLTKTGFANDVWYVFEGRSQPDVFLRTPNLIAVVEGKRTEHGSTRTTKWMRIRDQMLRHIDAAWEIRGNRRVVGLMIIEGNKGKDAVDVDAHWLAEASMTMSDDVVAASLPHRSPAERLAIRSAFLGVATWQRVCGKFNIPGTSLPDQC